MVFNQPNDRMQIDLVDMQTMADGEWKWILVCQDHLTKFIHLRPLKSKRAIEVAEHVLSIFLVFGAPTVPQSDNGREFCNAIIDSLRETWPELKIVHGRPRHSQSQGSVERANQDIQDMLTAWMMTYNSTEWVKGLQYVASKKNRAIHQGTGRSPYEAVFGTSMMKVGITTAIPSTTVPQMATEEKLQEFLEANFNPVGN
ncbi:hypothetical protein FOCC_FOCC014909 [Frankliniella occidentalis]|nr:hypothetical protein FOCC_FOCC014909 [Frankliniella occidentalis]